MHPATKKTPTPPSTLPRLVLGAVLLLASAGALAASAKPAAGAMFSNAPIKSPAAPGAGDDDDCDSDEVAAPRLAPAPAPAAPAPARAAPAASAKRAIAPVAGAQTPLVARVEVAAPRPAAPASSWEVAPSDKTLKAALSRWSASAHWQLVWELPVDYAVSVRTEVKGGFTEAVETVAKSMETADMPMKVIFYEGNRVLRIVAK